MKLPLNYIELLNTIEKERNNYFSFTKHIKEKYGLSEEQMKIIELFSFEEILALKIEQMLQVFNGKMSFPIREYFLIVLNKAFYRVLESYPTDKEKKQLKKLMLLTNNSKLKIISKYDQYMYKKGFDKD